MFQTIDDLRDHYLKTIPDIGAHEAHIRAYRELSEAHLDDPVDIRLKVLPTAQAGEAKAQK